MKKKKKINTQNSKRAQSIQNNNPNASAQLFGMHIRQGSLMPFTISESEMQYTHTHTFTHDRSECEPTDKNSVKITKHNSQTRALQLIPCNLMKSATDQKCTVAFTRKTKVVNSRF